MRGRGWTAGAVGVVLVAAVVAGLLGASVSPAPAGNRNPAATLVAFPGPGEVTYGQNVAYTSTFTNTQSSTFTHVLFHDPIPTTLVSGVGTQAVFKYASCTGQLTATEFVCDEIAQLTPGATAKVTIVWQTPAAGSSTGCPSATPVCMANSITWTLKEGTGQPGSAGPDTFPAGPVFTSLLVVPDFRKAGGYALGKCTGSSTTTLGTNGTVNATNPLSTDVCATTLPTGDAFNPGLVVTINERDHTASDPGFTQVSVICIPVPDGSCDNLSYTPWLFDPAATFTFVFDNTTLPKGVKITTIFHDGVPAPCTITVDNRTKTTKAVCTSATNGHWTGGG